MYNHRDRLFGLVFKATASRAKVPGFESHLRPGDFSGSSRASDLKIDTSVVPCKALTVIGLALGLVVGEITLWAT